MGPGPGSGRMAYAEHFILQLVSKLKQDQELNKWLTKPSCTLPDELMGELAVISMGDPGTI